MQFMPDVTIPPSPSPILFLSHSGPSFIQQPYLSLALYCTNVRTLAGTFGRFMGLWPTSLISCCTLSHSTPCPLFCSQHQLYAMPWTHQSWCYPGTFTHELFHLPKDSSAYVPWLSHFCYSITILNIFSVESIPLSFQNFLHNTYQYLLIFLDIYCFVVYYRNKAFVSLRIVSWGHNCLQSSWVSSHLSHQFMSSWTCRNVPMTAQLPLHLFSISFL